LSNGRPAARIALTAPGSTQPLGGRLPRTMTDNLGRFRFEHLRLGEYTLWVDDERAGYSIFATAPLHVSKVDLTAAQPVGELRVTLPPPAGFLHIHLTDRKTGAVIPSMQVELTRPDATRLYSTSRGSDRPVLIPPGKPVLLHVVAPGFYEWT